MSEINAIVRITWDYMEKDLRAIYPWAREQNLTCIIAVSRGGMVPAAILAQWLGIHKVDVVAIESYAATDDTKLDQLVMHKFPGALSYQHQSSALIVDDICDTGRTMEKLAQILPHAKRCALYGKEPAAAKHCHKVGRIVSNNIWLDFPWQAFRECA